MYSVLVILTAIAALGAALIAGAFFAFSSFIMTALGRLPAREGIAAMQSINVVVINRSFLGIFIGTAAISVVIAILAVTQWGSAHAPWFLAGALFYVIGTFLVTGAGNVPLNDQLAVVDATATGSVEIWSHYLVRWTQLNTLRTMAATLAALCFCVGLVRLTGT